MPSPSPPVPPLPPGKSTSSPFPVCRRLFQSFSRQGTFAAQKCCTEGTWGRVCYPPPVSQLYPACGGVQSESRGWSDLTPLPGTLLPGIRAATIFLGRRPRSLHLLGCHHPPRKIGLPQGSALPVVVHCNRSFTFPLSLWRGPLWMGVWGGPLWLYIIPVSISMILG